MISSGLLSEERIVKLVGDYMRANYYLTEEELVINSTVLDMQQIAGQELLRIDLAGVSMLDGGIIFIEAETEAFLDHPMIYKPVADYVFLACPLAKLEEKNSDPRFLEDLYRSAAEHGVGILGVHEVQHEGQLPFHVKVNAPVLPLRPAIRRAVLKSFEKRGHLSVAKYGAWWGLQ
ncbi:MAG: hypothetical protein ACFFD4_03965 [Candidatus Odinarchaeota archaeon]